MAHLEEHQRVAPVLEVALELRARARSSHNDNGKYITRTAHNEALIVRGTGYDMMLQW